MFRALLVYLHEALQSGTWYIACELYVESARTGVEYSYNVVLVLPQLITIRHQLGLDKPVSASSKGIFKGLRSFLRPFGL
jgi:hypothetical protein